MSIKPPSAFTWNGLGTHGDNILSGIAADTDNEQARQAVISLDRVITAYAYADAAKQDRYGLAIEVLLRVSAQAALNPDARQAACAHARLTFRALAED